MCSYVLTFAFLMTVMTNTCQYFYRHQPQRPSCCCRWSPFALLVVATVLLLAAPLKNLVVNVCMTSFHQHGFDETIQHTLDIAYLPVFGSRLLQVYTSAGCVCMFGGTALQMDIWGKLQASVMLSHATHFSAAD